MTLSITESSAKCRYAQYHYAEHCIFYCYAVCHYAECRYAECRVLRKLQLTFCTMVISYVRRVFMKFISGVKVKKPFFLLAK